MKKTPDFLVKENGATAVEYALMLGLIAAAVLLGATALGVNSNTLFIGIAGKILSAGS